MTASEAVPESVRDSGSDAVSVAVLGGSGYTGRELTRLLARHPRVKLVHTTSRSEEGSASPARGLSFSNPPVEALREMDVVFLCLPHGEAAAWAERLGAGTRDAGKRASDPRASDPPAPGADALPGPVIIDLTADHRPGSGREAGWVYGLNEWARDDLAGVRRVANPGCYPTGVLLALLPLVRAGLVDVDRLTVVSAASGVTGAGRSPRTDLLFAEVANNFRAYGWGNQHRHLLEMRALLPGMELLFQPHLLPIPRGIVETLVVPVRTGVDAEAVRRAWTEAYGSEPVVELLEAGLPGLDRVVETDRVALGVVEVADTREPALLVGAALDNLGKGAAGQAVQNLNAVFGWPTEMGVRT
jgi:N-acetyl-gamma-glutamyl-phosphate reductase